jgi:2-dehydro-3-deoxygalactonokinase
VEDLARALVEVPFPAAQVKLVPGLSSTDMAGVPEVMRGEETQIAGLLPLLGRNCVVCLPGTHSKWARIAAGAIESFTTHMTGEAFAALREHTILGRMIREAPMDAAAFDRGLAAADTPGGLLHHLFGVRTLGLFGALDEAAAGSYLSGLLVGHEVRAADPRGQVVHLIGAPRLCGLYGRAIEHAGGRPVMQDGDAAVRGLARIGELAEWS